MNSKKKTRVELWQHGQPYCLLTVIGVSRYCFKCGCYTLRCPGGRCGCKKTKSRFRSSENG